MSEGSRASVGQHYGLIVHQDEKVPRFLAKYVNLILNYHYGLPIRLAQSLDRGMLELGRGLRCAFVVQDRHIETRSAIQALSQQDHTPLFLMFPATQREHHESLCRGMANVYFCAWEDVFGRNGSSLQQTIEGRFAEDGIGNLFQELDQLSHQAAQVRLQTWLKSLDTLPTLPEIVLRIMALVNDPETTMEDLEGLLISDAAIVHKLLQAVSTPAFSGAFRQGEFSLKEAIVRLGLKKVGAIAQ